MRRALALALLLSFCASSVHAQERHARAMPRYGRAPDPGDPAEDLLWIPRVVFYPLHLIFEYGLRVPLRWLFRTIELEHLDALFVRGMPNADPSEARIWFVPLLRYDLGFQPSVGVGFRAAGIDDVGAVRASIEFWGIDQVRGRARGSLTYGASRISLGGLGSYRTDRIFHGLGWSSPPSPRVRYGQASGVGELLFTSRPWRRSSIQTGFRVDVERFEDTSFRQENEVPIEEAIRGNVVPAPPGYPDGYTAVGPFLRLVLDTRSENERGPYESGVRVEGFGRWAVDAERGPSSSWARGGGALQLAAEVMRERTLFVRGLAEIAEPLRSEEEVPFTEQISLGGHMTRMPGFLEGRLIGRSAASAGIGWRYAIWPWLDAELFLDTGNVFDAYFSQFDLERLRLSFGTALTTRDPDDFTFLLAFGTEPFVNGTDLSSVRVAIAVGAPP